MGPRAKHEIYLCFINAFYTQPKSNFLQYFYCTCVLRSGMGCYTCGILAFKKFWIMEHFKCQTLRLGALNLGQ
jgi:hypothetical protein